MDTSKTVTLNVTHLLLAIATITALIAAYMLGHHNASNSGSNYYHYHSHYSTSNGGYVGHTHSYYSHPSYTSRGH